MTLWVERFVRYLGAERGLAENTIAGYTQDLCRFSESITVPLLEAGRSDVRAFMAKQLQDGCDPRSVARRLSAIRHFYRFLLDEEVVQTDPTVDLPVPKSWKTMPKSISVEEVQAMADGLSSTSAQGLRHRAMVLTCFAAGLRVSELAALRLEDVDLDQIFLTVRQGKGSKDRIAPLNPIAVSALRAYLEIGRPQLRPRDGDSTVFLGRWGKPLTRQAIFYEFRDLAELTIGKSISPHWLRHSFGTVLIAGGADLRAVQAMMGHASIDTTQIYLDVDLRMMRGTYYATHPRARRATQGVKTVSDVSLDVIVTKLTNGG